MLLSRTTAPLRSRCWSANGTTLFCSTITRVAALNQKGRRRLDESSSRSRVGQRQEARSFSTEGKTPATGDRDDDSFFRQLVPGAFQNSMDSLEDLGPHLDPKSAGMLGGVAGSFFAWYKARQSWRARRFDKRITVSLNTLEPASNNADANGSASGSDARPILRFRTLMERDIDGILHHPQSMKVLSKFMAKTTVEEPFLKLPADDAFFVMNPFVNAITEATSIQGFIAADMGLPVERKWYWVGLSNERLAKQSKLRVMVIRDDTLCDIASENITNVRLEHPAHAQRWRTLKKMASLLRTEGEDGTNQGETQTREEEETPKSKVKLLRPDDSWSKRVARENSADHTIDAMVAIEICTPRLQ